MVPNDQKHIELIFFCFYAIHIIYSLKKHTHTHNAVNLLKDMLGNLQLKFELEQK